MTNDYRLMTDRLSQKEEPPRLSSVVVRPFELSLYLEFVSGLVALVTGPAVVHSRDIAAIRSVERGHERGGRRECAIDLVQAVVEILDVLTIDVEIAETRQVDHMAFRVLRLFGPGVVVIISILTRPFATDVAIERDVVDARIVGGGAFDDIDFRLLGDDELAVADLVEEVAVFRHAVFGRAEHELVLTEVVFEGSVGRRHLLFFVEIDEAVHDVGVEGRVDQTPALLGRLVGVGLTRVGVAAVVGVAAGSERDEGQEAQELGHVAPLTWNLMMSKRFGTMIGPVTSHQ